MKYFSYVLESFYYKNTLNFKITPVLVSEQTDLPVVTAQLSEPTNRWLDEIQIKQLYEAYYQHKEAGHICNMFFRQGVIVSN